MLAGRDSSASASPRRTSVHKPSMFQRSDPRSWTGWLGNRWISREIEHAAAEAAEHRPATLGAKIEGRILGSHRHGHGQEAKHIGICNGGSATA